MEKGLFRWYYNPEKGFIGSGLDDYPRNENSEYYSLDLQVWMCGFVDVLKSIHILLNNTAKSQYYSALQLIYTENLNRYFYDPSD